MGQTAEVLARAVRHHARRVGRLRAREPAARGGRDRGRPVQGRDHAGAGPRREGQGRRARRRRASARRDDDRVAAQAAAGLRAGRRAAGHHHRRDRRRASPMAAPRSCWRARTKRRAAAARRWRASSAGRRPASIRACMGIGPVPAVRKLLARTGLALDDFDLVELNEAFAPQVLAVLRDLPIDRDAPERQRRRDRARPPDWRHRHAHSRDAAVRDGAARRPPRPRDALRQRRAGDCVAVERHDGSRQRSRDIIGFDCACRSHPRRRHRQGRHGRSRQGAARVGRGRGPVDRARRRCRGAPITTSQTGVTIPPNGYAMLRDDFDAILLGALGDPRVPDNRHARDILLGTRFELDLYVNYRPVRLLDDRLCPLKDRGREGRELRRVPREHRGRRTSASAAGSRPARRTRSRFRKRSTPTRACNRIIRHAFEFARGAAA